LFVAEILLFTHNIEYVSADDTRRLHAFHVRPSASIRSRNTDCRQIHDPTIPFGFTTATTTTTATTRLSTFFVLLYKFGRPRRCVLIRFSWSNIVINLKHGYKRTPKLTNIKTLLFSLLFGVECFCSTHIAFR